MRDTPVPRQGGGGGGRALPARRSTSSRADLLSIRDRISRELSEAEAEIYDAHLLILDDPDLLGAVEKGIRKERRNAAWVFRAHMAGVAAILAGAGSEHMRERQADVLDVERRVLRHLLGTAGRTPGRARPAVRAGGARPGAERGGAARPRARRRPGDRGGLALVALRHRGARARHPGGGLVPRHHAAHRRRHGGGGGRLPRHGRDRAGRRDPGVLRGAAQAHRGGGPLAPDRSRTSPPSPATGTPSTWAPTSSCRARSSARSASARRASGCSAPSSSTSAGSSCRRRRSSTRPTAAWSSACARARSCSAPWTWAATRWPRTSAPPTRATRSSGWRGIRFVARVPGRVPHPAARHLPRQRARPRARHVPDGLEPRRAARAPRRCAAEVREELAARRRAARRRARDRAHDRDAERGVDGGRPGARGELLLDRHERPDPVHAGDGPRQRAPRAPVRAARSRRPAQHPPHRRGRARGRPLGRACAARWPATRTSRSLLLGLDVDELSVACFDLPRVKSAIRGVTYAGAQALAAEALEQSTADDVKAVMRRHIDELLPPQPGAAGERAVSVLEPPYGRARRRGHGRAHRRHPRADRAGAGAAGRAALAGAAAPARAPGGGRHGRLGDRRRPHARRCTRTRLPLPLEVVRDYRWPGWVGADALTLLSSYSGDTEETLALYRDAARARGDAGGAHRPAARSARCCARDGVFVHPLPPGSPPRAALFSSWVALTGLLHALGWIADPAPGWREAAAGLAARAAELGAGRARGRATRPSGWPASWTGGSSTSTPARAARGGGAALAAAAPRKC